MNKKGILFSLAAIALSSLFVLLFSNTIELGASTQNEIVRTRVLALDQSIDEFYVFVEEAQQIAGYEALTTLFNEIKDTDDFLDDFETEFLECLENSTSCYNGQDLETLLDNYTTALMQNQNIDLNYIINDISIEEENQWSIIITSNVTVRITDVYANWDLSKEITTRISTVGIHDPAYVAINQMYGGSHYPVISKNTVVRVNANITNFMDYYTAQEYFASTNGPCLSQRFENDTGTPSGDCGIESVVNPNDHSTIIGTGYSMLDWQVLNKVKPDCDDQVAFDHNTDLLLNKTDAVSYGIYPDHTNTNTC